MRWLGSDAVKWCKRKAGMDGQKRTEVPIQAARALKRFSTPTLAAHHPTRSDPCGCADP
jgi:hypothetical protein